MKTHNIFSIDEFKTIIGTNCRLLGIDPGSKNIGIAICDENQMVATPLKIIQKNKLETLLEEIKLIISENNIKGIVVGNPINMDSSISKSSQAAFDFSKNLSQNILNSVLYQISWCWLSRNMKKTPEMNRSRRVVGPRDFVLLPTPVR